MKGLVRACHPEPTAAVTTLMTALAVAAGRGWGSVWVLLGVLAGQLSVGWSNDWIDRDRDRRAGRREKPIVSGAVAARTVGIGAAVALVACVPLSFASGPRAAAAHLTGVAFAWAYNLRLKTTPLSVVPYVVAFALLPSFVTFGLPGTPAAPWWATAAGGLLGAGAHFANTVPDLASDAHTGVRGLPHRVGLTWSVGLAASLLGAAVVVLAVAPILDSESGTSSAAGTVATTAATAVALVCVGGVVVAVLRGRPRLGWRLTLLTAAVAVGLLIARGGSLA
ncbi:MAG TPA: UbiA family prenyltransferase [Mycobacteriales bacterium]|nr:UbiA family prenyltransferase [Mycobacteriales bacterium]